MNDHLSDGCTSDTLFGSSFHSVCLGVSSASSRLCLWILTGPYPLCHAAPSNAEDTVIFLRHCQSYIHPHISFFSSWLLPIFLGQSSDVPHSLEELTRSNSHFSKLCSFSPLSVLSSQGPKFSTFTLIHAFPSACVYHQHSKLGIHQE